MSAIGHTSIFTSELRAAIKILQLIHFRVANRPVQSERDSLRHRRANAGERRHPSHDVDTYRSALGFLPREKLRTFLRRLRLRSLQPANQIQIDELHLRFLLGRLCVSAKNVGQRTTR